MSFTVVYDACVLYPAPLRDLFLRVAMTSVVRARWSDDILDECFRSILAQRPDLNESALNRTRELMTQAIPDCLIDDFQELVDGLTLPDPDDRHALAAAIRAGAQAIVTFNRKDFPASALSKYGVEALQRLVSGRRPTPSSGAQPRPWVKRSQRTRFMNSRREVGPSVRC
jgi:predicted nucleic acid-binding protein